MLLGLLLAIGGLLGYRYFVSNKDKEVRIELVEELTEFEMGINEEGVRGYLKQLGVLPITDRQITVIDEAGVRQEKIGKIDKIIFGLKDINKLESDLATGVMRADRLGKTMAGEAGLKLVVYSRPVKTGKGVLESVVYINASWFGEEERKPYIGESLSQAILVNMLLGVRGEWSADPENYIRQKLGRYGGVLVEKKTQGFQLVKPAMAQYCSGVTLCEQEVWRCYCEEQNVGLMCYSDLDCSTFGTCTDCKWTCSEGAAQVGVPCQYIGSGKCGGNCEVAVGPGWCDIGACGWAYYGPTSTPAQNPTQIPQITDTPWPARGSWSVFYFYDKNANGQFDSGDERLPEAVRSQTGLWVRINGYRDYTYGGGLPTIYAQDSVDRKVGCLMGCTGSSDGFGDGNQACDTQPCFFNTLGLTQESF